MNKASELATITKLFAENKNVSRYVFTMLYQRVMLELPTRLEFDEQGVSVHFKGQEDNILLHQGPFVLELGTKEREG